MKPEDGFEVAEGDDVNPTPPTRPEPRRRVRSRRTRPASEAMDPPKGPPFLLSSRFLLLLAAVFTGGLLLGCYNPTFGLVRPVWPWVALGMGGQAGGPESFEWNSGTALVVYLALFAGGFLLAACLPSGRGRGILALGIAALAMVTLGPDIHSSTLYRAALVVAVAAGVLIGLANRQGEGAGRGLVLVVLLLLAAWLFLPMGQPGPGYSSQGVDFWRELTGPDPQEHVPTPARLPGLWEDYPTPVTIGVALLLLLALSWLLGVRHRWIAWASLIVLLAVTLAPMALLFRIARSHAPSGQPWVAALRPTAAMAFDTFLLFMVGVAAGVQDLLLRPRVRG